MQSKVTSTDAVEHYSLRVQIVILNSGTGTEQRVLSQSIL
jgi:hypothetical protein